MKCYLWLNCGFESDSPSPSTLPPPSIHLSHLPPPHFLRAGFTLVPVILLPFVSVGLFAIECCFLSLPPPPPVCHSPLPLPSPPLLSLTCSFTLGPNYEIASNKYMYFFPLLLGGGGRGKPCAPIFFFFFLLNSRFEFSTQGGFIRRGPLRRSKWSLGQDISWMQ